MQKVPTRLSSFSGSGREPLNRPANSLQASKTAPLRQFAQKKKKIKKIQFAVLDSVGLGPYMSGTREGRVLTKRQILFYLNH
jgi:hypothetical protein